MLSSPLVSSAKPSPLWPKLRGKVGRRFADEHGQKRLRQNADRSRHRIQDREVVSTVYRQQASRKAPRGGSGMAFGGWLAGAVYDYAGFYAIAFTTGIRFNLVHLTLIGVLVWRKRLRMSVGRPRPAPLCDEWNQGNTRTWHGMLSGGSMRQRPL
jgi:hypothetical protein